MTTLSRKKKFLDLFPVPEFMLISSSGIAITDDIIRFVEFKRASSGAGLRLVHCGSAPTPEGSVEAGFVHDTAHLGKALSDLSREYGVRHTFGALPDEKAYLFTALIDKVPQNNMHDAVAFILEENAPVSLNQSVFDFEVVKEVPDKGKLKVAVAVLSEKKVETYSDAFRAGGIVPVSFDLESQAIARAIVPRGDARAHLLINLDKERTGIYIVEDEVVQFSSVSPHGTSGQAPDLKAEVRKVFAFWNSRIGEEGLGSTKIVKVLVCGEEAVQAEFIKELLSDIEVEWQLAQVWVNAFSMHHKVPEVPFEESLGFAAAIGLALPRREISYV